MNTRKEQRENLASSATDDCGTSIPKDRIRCFTSDPYPMNVTGRKRGLARIFSHSEYSECLQSFSPRRATEYDNDRLNSLLQNFGFEVKLCPNYKTEQIFNELLEVSKMDHSNFECLAIFIMTHGDSGILAAYDFCYDVSRLWYYFTKTKCPTLNGKPKLFFIQACRGDATDNGVCMTFTNLPQPSPTYNTSNCACMYEPISKKLYETPREPDFLIAYATAPGFYSFNSNTGSWFMQKLCYILEEYGKKYDLLTLLTFVAQEIAIDCESCSDTWEIHEKKQIPSIVTTLQRPLYFYPSEIEEVPAKLQLKSLYDRP